jgi:cytochrome c biogenesis protein CcmG/thiol:disulfide interchange protein DsbE
VISRRRLIVAGALLAFLRPDRASAKDPFDTLQLFRPRRRTTAPDFAVPGLGGSPIRLGDFKGQVILLNFWATWCPPCREEMPSMERLYRRFKSRGFTILALSIDRRGEQDVGPFVKSFALTFPIGLDPGMTVAGEYRMAGLPTSILIDRHGAIAAVAAGARDWDSPAAHQVIEQLLEGR